jgi:hypothetical protein
MKVLKRLGVRSWTCGHRNSRARRGQRAERRRAPASNPALHVTGALFDSLDASMRRSVMEPGCVDEDRGTAACKETLEDALLTRFCIYLQRRGEGDLEASNQHNHMRNERFMLLIWFSSRSSLCRRCPGVCQAHGTDWLSCFKELWPWANHGACPHAHLPLVDNRALSYLQRARCPRKQEI